ncbi:sigma 54-interacting transcriptional regulator [Pyxidicoccus xibeiensis]|uniref:sigma 54-interacting transcriptional regulator n=1 Tax=Pyxidicoccus xibeiensis TaxID=2906759 RepID=UPI0020A72224|nr:sigma 54-interacting transcriptional regulator [Pyxidicoccus xibeiensis]MCP3138308.1 sigma 54-interacting transcriptional regulator [Pyxidicoccus xibeiensis]
MSTPRTSPLTEKTDPDAPPRARLFVMEGPDRGRTVLVEGGTVVVGTLPSCQLVLSDDTVSRQHLSLELLGTRARVRDLGSRNGTRYLGARVEVVEVPLGAIVSLGRTQLALLPADASPERLSERTELAGLLGRSLAMRRLFAEVERVAPVDVPVLIQGETGSGKEGIARALHVLSGRTGALHAFDCGSVPPALLPGLLFGHVRGAFTGAVADTPGALEAAHEGTLFLDEVAELPLELQPVFLRVLETGRFCRLGETRERSVRFRLVAATHRDLAAAMKKGTFRPDLYHRLASIVLRAPPLRDRLDDIPLLAEHFARTLGASLPLSPASLATLSAYSWPGNVRELRNAVERTLTLGAEAALPELAPGVGVGVKEDFHATRERVLQAFERSYLEALLARHRGSASAAAREAGLARSYFYRLLKTHGLAPGRGRG